jgi:hypothetical protein
VSDEVNDLMERCEAARRRCESKHGKYSIQDFVVSYNAQIPGDRQWKPWMLWYVGFSEPDQGKHTAQGETLPAALKAWLELYEDWWEDVR